MSCSIDGFIVHPRTSRLISFGIGMWFLFTFLWALSPLWLPLLGVAIGQENDASWIMLEGALDLLSPNGGITTS